MRSNAINLALAAVICAAVLAPTATGSPSADATAVVRDYLSDKKITPCRFTQGQLENTRNQIGPDQETYSVAFGAAVDREIKRWTDGKCASKRSVDLRIVKVQSKGGARKESVTIKNFGSKTVNLRRYVLRDGADHTIRFRTTKLKPGRQVRVITGCRKGVKGAVRRGTRYYACRKKQFWDDAGDVVELVTPNGGLLSSKTYGTPAA